VKGGTLGLRLAALLLALYLVCGVAPGRASADAAGTLAGQVQNATAGAPAPVGIPVTLHIVGEGDQVQRRDTTTDQDGRFSFSGLDVSAGLKYLPTVDYQGTLYFDRVVSLADQPEQTVAITVYEGTTTDQLIAFERSNLLVQNIAPNRLDLMEMGSVANLGDRTYVGAEPAAGAARATLLVAVPPGAVDLAPQAGIRPTDLTSTPTGFALNSPILPGRHQLAFSYSLPYSSDRLIISKRLTYPAASFTLYLPDVGLQVNSPQLEAGGQTELGGQKFLQFSGQNLPRGTELWIELANLPTSGSSAVDRLTAPMLAVGGLALLAGVALVGCRRLTVDPPSAGGRVPARAELDRLQVLLTLASLDERFDQGELDEAAYHREREAEKQRLRALSEPAVGAGAGGR
jgi:5-hydroxyisourate hydrolase-like protein (transthyretin family)